MKDSLKAAAWTSLFSFVTLFSITLIGWLQDVAEWASSDGGSAFPDLSVLGYGVVAAFAAAVTGLVNWAVRYAQSRGVIPGTVPNYERSLPPPPPPA